MELLLGIFAFVLGFAARRGQTCAVLAVHELLEKRRWDRSWSFILCAAWAAVVALPLAWWHEGARLAPALPVTGASLLGGILFGVGAAVNGACTFGSLNRIVSGQASYGFVLPGIALGAYASTLLVGRWAPAGAGNPMAEPHRWSLLAWAVA
ncbi:MAG: hypothetical protein D6782_13225, partial [Alphaproteobacteria bacterium]